MLQCVAVCSGGRACSDVYVFNCVAVRVSVCHIVFSYKT